ncbi:PIG-L family deacetylase [Roseisolibacter sp. H3M3-2]|uniref:PIG-L deacetylase family protein n=1 Tax=Roseisolibacter sp. H3M3-2 TaxID=3031323 RepID=UPI0023DC73C2|nr:PIG-L family deacetylase [Roseisolibacter sp. H3M3-2]MDF1503844.1 PIG-L family deacetylase [Roseisolibacter sp. H3M3-2]
MLVSILAHPDDESFMLASTAARLADAGTTVGLICATRGQAGSAGDPPLVSRDALPAVRERELRDACAILGIELLALLDHQDKHLHEADPDAMREVLVAHIRRQRPTVVLSFDPKGVSGHADHQAIGRFAHDAVVAAADARYAPHLGAPHAVRRMVWPAPLLPGDAATRDEFAAHWGVDYLIDGRAYRDRKVAALRTHRTQHRSVDREWFGEAHARTGGTILDWEAFRHAWGEPPPTIPADDLFAGLDDPA